MFEYWISDNETVHVALQAADIIGAKATLCGKPLTNMTIGDESPSGIAATCGSCKRLVARRRPPDPPRGRELPV